MALLGSHKAEDFATTDETRLDWRMIVAALVIMLIGVANVHSATSAGGWATSIVLKQFAYMGVGMGVIALILAFDYRIIERMAWIGYGFNLFALMLVPVIGSMRLGARRWIDLGFLSYQPSETMKLMVLIALAKYFHKRDSLKAMDFKDLIIPGMIVGIPSLLTIIQPDLGTGAHLAMGGLVMMLFVGIRRRVLITAIIAGIVSFPIAWEYVLKPYQRDRIQTFMDPMADPKGAGYNVIQSMIAVGSGQITGKGYKKGTQTQLEFTPEGHTDFIFTVLAEEWGLMGVTLLFAAYIYLFSRCVYLASTARDKFGSLLCVGIIGMLISQVVINLSMVMGMFPIVGIPLPLMSYGGTSVLTVCIALGILLNVGYRRTIF